MTALTPEDIKSIAASGEGYNAEFKFKIPAKLKELSQEVCAFANSGGGYLFIGVDDLGNVAGATVDNTRRSDVQDAIRHISPVIQVEMYPVDVDGKTVWVIAVPSGKDKPYVLSGAIYVREGSNTQKLTSADEMRHFFQSNNRIYFDAVACSQFDIIEELDRKNFKQFLLESSISGNISTQQILNNLQVFDESGVIKNGGVLFFGQQPEKYFHQAIVRCVRFKGTTKVHIIDDKKYGGPLYQQYLQAEAWIKDKLEVAYIIEGMGPRKEVWEIPLTVFKEAIINALSHRDYYERGAGTMIEIYDDRVEISNPGGLLMGVKKEFGKKSMTRNPLIFGLFTRMHLVEQVASGIPRMRDEMREAGLPEPVFSTEGGFFSVEFKRLQKNDIVNSDDDIVKSDNDTVNFENDTVKSENDPINLDDDPINSEDDPINLNNDPVNLEGDPINLENDTVNLENDTVKSEDDTVKSKNDTVKSEDDTVKSKNDTVKKDSDIEDDILKLITENEGLLAPKLSKQTGKSIITIKRYLAKLKESGKIEFRGAPKTGGYYVKKNG